jgi:hypothetical protein
MNEKLNKFLGMPKKYVICGEEMEISPLPLSEAKLFLNLGLVDKEKQGEMIKELIIKTLMKSFNATKEEVEALALNSDLINELMQAILDVHGVKGDDLKKLKGGSAE